MDDKSFVQLVGHIDQILADLYSTYNQPTVLELSAILLARIVIANDIVGSGREFRDMITNVIEQQEHQSHELH